MIPAAMTGPDFTSPNAESDPHVPIVQISETPPFAVKPGAGEAPRPARYLPY